MACKVHRFTLVDCVALNHIFAFLQYSKSTRLCIDGSAPLQLKVYTDADWAGNVEDRQSISGSITYLGNTPICWHSKKQPCVSLSTMEAEYSALVIGCQDAIWLN